MNNGEATSALSSWASVRLFKSLSAKLPRRKIIVALASSDSSFVNGIEVHVDGGMSLV